MRLGAPALAVELKQFGHSGRHSMRRDLLNEVRMRGSVSPMAHRGGSLWDRFSALIVQRNPPRASHFYPVGCIRWDKVRNLFLPSLSVDVGRVFAGLMRSESDCDTG